MSSDQVTASRVDAAPLASPAVVLWEDGPAWDAFVAAAADGSIGHRWAWLGVVERAYGHRTYPLAAVSGGRLRGVLPLVLVRSRLFGRHLVSMPYLDSAGVCSGGDDGAERALVARARATARSVGAGLELRHRSPRDNGLAAWTGKVTMTLSLDGDEPVVWRRIRSNRRGQVRKAQRAGLTVTRHGFDGVAAFFDVLATNMRDLGSPCHRRRFFAATLDALNPDARILLVRSAGRVVGAGLVLRHGDEMVLPFSSSLRSAFALGANQILYWEAIRLAIEDGCRVFDFGRSSPGSGTYEAKREWGGEPTQLHWYRDPARSGAGDGSRALGAATRLWRHLPVPVATAGGHLLRGGLPQ
jgi:FemAB-related protein (PEP-CTERM system-associated)